MGTAMIQGINPPGQSPLGLPVASLFDEDVAVQPLSHLAVPSGHQISRHRLLLWLQAARSCKVLSQSPFLPCLSDSCLHFCLCE